MSAGSLVWHRSHPHAQFGHGFGHPFGGLDHILAMVAVGLFAANLGGRAIWHVPTTFVGMMAIGGALGIAGVSLPLVGFGIVLSVVVLELAVALHWNLPTAAAMALVGFFAVFHGYAHGVEMPVDSGRLSYAVGFMVATALLHCAGLALGLGVGLVAKTRTSIFSRVAGGLMAIAGVGILTGVL